jgi:ankyrin repeat protein
MSLVDAVEAKNVDEIRRLANNGEYLIPGLFRAVYAEDLEIIQLLLDLGADIHYLDNKPFFLFIAVMKGNKDMVNLLLDRGADVDEQNRHGQTALVRAVQSEHLDIVRILLDRGADVNGRDFQENTPLIWACSGYPPNKDIVQLLLERGADKTLRDGRGETVLDRMRPGEIRTLVETFGVRPATNDGLEDRLPEELNAEFENLQCPICTELLFQPKTLPCGHTLCEGCKKTMEERVGGAMVPCPMCRAMYDKTKHIDVNKAIQERCNVLRSRNTGPKGGQRKQGKQEKQGKQRKQRKQTRRKNRTSRRSQRTK